MNLIKSLKTKIILFKLAKKIKNLDSKYFVTLCDNWETNNKIDNAWCFPYDKNNPNFGHTKGEFPLSFGLNVIIQKTQKENSIVLNNFEAKDEQLVREYIFMKTGKNNIICS